MPNWEYPPRGMSVKGCLSWRARESGSATEDAVVGSEPPLRGLVDISELSTSRAGTRLPAARYPDLDRSHPK